MDIVFAPLNLFCTLLYWWVLVTPVITPVMESALSPVSRRLSSTSSFDGAPFPFDFWLGLASRRNQQRLENMRGEVGLCIPWAASLLGGGLAESCVMEGHSPFLGGHLLQVSLHMSL